MAIDLSWVIYMGLAIYLGLAIFCIAAGYLAFCLARHLKPYIASRRRNKRHRDIVRKMYPSSLPIKL